MGIEITNKITQYSQSYFSIKEVEDSFGFFILIFENGDRSQPYKKSIFSWRRLDD